MTVRAFLAAAVFAVASVAATPARAQDANSVTTARELMALLRMEAVLTDFFAQMSPMVAGAMARDMHLNPVEEARLGELVAEEFRTAAPAIVEEMAQVYASRMSEQQLQETVVFLRSPSGAAFLQTQVDAQTELERIGGAAGLRVGVQAVARLIAERAGDKPRGPI